MSEISKTGADTYSSAIADADNYTRWIIDLMRPFIGRAVLEVGLGHGGYREHLPGNLSYTGIDLDPAAVALARNRYPGDTCFVADITSASFVADVRAGNPGIDTVICANVLEHVDADELAVTNMLNALDSGGRLLLYLPAHQTLYGHMDKLAGHYRRYSHGDLERLTGDARIISWRYVNPIGALGWWLNKNIAYDDLDNTAINQQIRWFDRFVLPLSRGVTPLTRHWFGQSLYCVLEAA